MKQAKIISDVELCCNLEYINVGYQKEYACTVGQLKEMLAVRPDSALVYFKSRLGEDRYGDSEDRSEMWIMQCEMESDEDYELRLAKNEEAKKRAAAENEGKSRKEKLEQYNRLKNELGL